MIDNLSLRREVDWKKVLRSIVGNKKANQRKTLMRRDRRLPFANWIKGKTKNRIFELGVVSDVSGSVLDDALMEVWGEIISICDMFNTPVTMIQIDTEPTPPEKLTKKTRLVERKASGGTILSPAIDQFKDYRISFDALVITTDGYLFEDDIFPFQKLNKPVIWLIESNGQIMPEMNQGMMKAIKLSKT
jgi:predicted metal-dependent peptidase